FAGLVNPCLDITGFEKIDLRRAIRKLSELEAQGKPEARSHSIAFRSSGGWTNETTSPKPSASVLEETDFGKALDIIRKRSIGHIGNFYWLDSSDISADHNLLEDEVHTIIVGNKRRINFTTPNREEDIRYVLSRVRAISK
ncbi:MAG: hypothetical protein QME51_10270, partial [Planctomycetota bacterium]|nr:hypothetical protein [Planctomycetota bacterium]MDI6788743.1 hypothetical protein [Planctomycetota bacterium]